MASHQSHPHPTAQRTATAKPRSLRALVVIDGSEGTPSAVSEHSSQLIGCPISRSLTTCCVHLELRFRPSTGITRLPRYTEPLRHPRRPVCPSRASGCSSLTTHWGFPCCARSPFVHAVATAPAQRLGHIRSLNPPVSAFPEGVIGSACALSFSRLARRSLALRPAHARCHRIS